MQLNELLERYIQNGAAKASRCHLNASQKTHFPLSNQVKHFLNQQKMQIMVTCSEVYC